MKELSLEEKARAYDEAIERAKEMIKAMTNIGGVAKVDDIQYLFPELKESESEKIRKELIQYLKEYNNLPNGQYCRADFFTWLEKQGEQKSAWSEEDEEQARQIERIVHNEGYSKKLQKQISDWLKSLKDRVHPQLKQEWKQENTDDLTDFENAMMHIGGSFFGQYAGLDPNDTSVVKEQAKLLLELIPSKEWSEEDKSLCRQIEGILSVCRTKSLLSFDLYKKMLDWLKSLKDRHTWKPSDAQMASITCAVRKMKESACYDSE